jgi:hypothetical protein
MNIEKINQHLKASILNFVALELENNKVYFVAKLHYHSEEKTYNLNINTMYYSKHESLKDALDYCKKWLEPNPDYNNEKFKVVYL